MHSLISQVFKSIYKISTSLEEKPYHRLQRELLNGSTGRFNPIIARINGGK